MSPTISYADLKPLFDYPLQECFETTVTLYACSFTFGEIFQVDQLWIILPIIYTGYWALLPLWPSYEAGAGEPFAHMFPKKLHILRTTSVLALCSCSVLRFAQSLLILWMLRSSYNTWRQGLFGLTDENYSWAVLRTERPTWLFRVIKPTFIVVIKNVLLLLIATPTLIAEFTADNQQYAYNAWKHSAMVAYEAQAHWPGARLAWTADHAERGFCTRGLWAWSRHPNFFAEQAFWGVLNLMPILYLPSGALVLFPAGDSTLVDALQSLFISAGMYPWGYAAYSERVAMFVLVLTPVWGALLGSNDQKPEVEALVWGEGAREGEVLGPLTLI
ncbi:DUF1295-domain-containing protein [Lactarius indigo]|nr:DUF1295-domain-containing protein [Lactarius indigo]